MSHHEREADFIESIAGIDATIAQRVSTWERELTRDQFKERIRDLMDDLEDERHWVGREGDDAAMLHALTTEYYNSLK